MLRPEVTPTHYIYHCTVCNQDVRLPNFPISSCPVCKSSYKICAPEITLLKAAEKKVDSESAANP